MRSTTLLLISVRTLQAFGASELRQIEKTYGNGSFRAEKVHSNYKYLRPPVKLSVPSGVVYFLGRTIRRQASPAIDFPHYAKLGRVSIHINVLTGHWSTTRSYAYLLIYHDLLVNIALNFVKLFQSRKALSVRSFVSAEWAVNILLFQHYVKIEVSVSIMQPAIIIVAFAFQATVSNGQNTMLNIFWD